MRRRSITTALVALVATTALTLTACSDDGGRDEDRAEPTTTEDAGPATTEPASTSTEAPTTTETSGPQSEEDAILAAHAGFWGTWLEANDPPDPAHPGLDAYYSGDAYDTAVQSISDNLALGQVLRLPEGTQWRHDAAVVSIDGDVAFIEDCAVDDGMVVVASTGQVLNDAIVTNSYRATLEKVDCVWKVVRNERVQKWEGVAGCAVE